MKKLLMIVLCCVAAVSVASAHAFLDHAIPAVGSTLKESPKEVRIWFTEGLVLPFSTVKVTDAEGHEVQKGDKHLDPSNGSVLIVSLQALKPGKYTVAWRVTASDTHVTQGTFPFEVKP